MLIHILGILNQTQLQEFREALGNANFVDGSLSAGATASRVKRNEEVSQDDQNIRYLSSVVMSALQQNWVFQNAIMPVSNTMPIFSRYTEGMHYGMHLDASLSAGISNHQDPLVPEKRFRTDVSSTVFLNEPDDYEGGELELHTPVGVATVKYAAGDVVLYPSTYLHQVKPVISGTRLVCVCWYQCTIKDAEKRNLVYELNVASTNLLNSHPGDPPTQKVNFVLHNLLRMWGET